LSKSDVHRRLKFGFFVFSHALVRPLTYREPIRFETMPSRPKPQAWRKMAAPSPVIASGCLAAALLLRESIKAQKASSAL
jgi:negative regulator of sigma E activity